ncbi:MAG TPA: hypothetical protein VF407_23065 [Polyangiaceae bacterium]
MSESGPRTSRDGGGHASPDVEVERTRPPATTLEENHAVAAPILKELREVGFDIDGFHALRQLAGQAAYRHAVPVLLRWLSKVDNADIKEELVRSLSVPSARPSAAIPLIHEFKKQFALYGVPYAWSFR